MLISCQRGDTTMKVFLACPVRNVTPEQKERIDAYVAELESRGIKVHYPPRDTNQDDPTGLSILRQNIGAIYESDEFHIFYDKTSEGSKFDIGAAFILNKRFKLANPEDVQRTQSKSFENVLLLLNDGIMPLGIEGSPI